jgi:crotonobetainyl-CoA:carnitine CoA-transferase CaiB-like acyl-CoA transferase
MSGPICAGLTVVELGAGSIAGSLAGMIFADNGARVIKVEPPDGDPLRAASPSGFLVWNRGKESIELDLRVEAVQQEVRQMLASADVAIVAGPPTRAAAWGLAYDDVRHDNPALVYCAITGFGADGPYANLKAYEGVVAAKLGWYSRGMFGFRDGPIFTGAPTASTGAAHLAVSGVLAALIAREATGRGQRVDTSLARGLIPADYFGIYHAQLAARAAAAGGSGPNTAPGGGMGASRYSLTVPTKDGRWVALSPQQPHQAHALLAALGLEWTLEDERFAKAPFFRDADDAQAWEDLVWERFRAQSWEEIQPQLLAQSNLPFELCGTSEEALDHPQIVANGESITIEDPRLGPVRQVGPVATFAKSPSVITRSAPALDANAGGVEPAAARPTTEAAPPQHALSGVTILEFGYFYAMPYGVTLAASLGARVIKLEDGNGDPMRQAFGGEAGSAKVTEGKESLSIDLKSEAGRAIVHRLVEEADMFVLGFRPGVAERLGVDEATLSAINPKLVYVHASGYGASGPYAPRPIYATTALALAGNLPRHAGFWMNPELSADFSVVELQTVIAPRLRGPIDGDSNAAQTACTALMLGLFHQRRTGEGQFLASSMIGGNVYSYADDAVVYQGKPAVLASDPEQYGLSALYRLYPVADGWIFLAAATEREQAALENALGVSLPDGDDARIALLAEVLAERKAKELEQVLSDVGVGVAAVAPDGHPATASTDPVMLDTGLVVEIDHPLFGTIRRHGLPAVLSDSPGRTDPGCVRGQHNRTILAELGYADDEIDGFERDGIVFAAE